MSLNETKQGLRYQQRVKTKYQKNHEAAGGNGWPERYRADCAAARAAAALAPAAEEIVATQPNGAPL